MAPYLSAQVLTLQELLSGRYRFVLPWFQRAYAWSEVQAGRLLLDLAAARNDSKPYVLGAIFLATPPDSPTVGLIDGHQRLITFTILFSLLRDSSPDDQTRAAADRAIADRAAAPPANWIQPQPNIAEFFEAWVQRPGGTRQEPPGDIMQLTDSERNILANRNDLRQRIDDELAPADRAELVKFMLERCLVVVKSVADEEDAWTIVSTEEETGLSAHWSERTKVTLISGMPRHEQDAAGRIYERCQGLIGHDEMSRLLSHIRAIKLRKRSAKPIEKDLMQRFALDKGGLGFLETEVKPLSELVARIKRKQLGAGAADEHLAVRLETLSWLDNQFWMPPLLYWLSANAAESPVTQRFVDLVERLAWVMKIAGIDPIDQEARFLRLLGDVDRGEGPDAARSLAIEDRLHAALLGNLRARTFYAKRYSGLVLRRISYNVDPAGDRGPVDGDRVTIEHVLPRRPMPGSGWWASFRSADEIGEHVNKLGNLVFLSLPDNQAAGRQEWPEKRAILAASGMHLSVRAARDHETWTRDTIEQRTETLIEALLTPWQIPATRARR